MPDENTLQPPLDGKYVSLDLLSPSEIRAEVEMWRRVWEWLPENVRFNTSKIGEVVRFVPRMGNAAFGQFLGATYELKEVEVGVEEASHDFIRGMKIVETKTVRMPLSNILQWQYIHRIDEYPAEAEIPTPDAVKMASGWGTIDEALKGV